MHKNKRKSLEFLKKKTFFYVTILFLHKSLIQKKYTPHHYNEDKLILVRLKIDNITYQNGCTYGSHIFRISIVREKRRILGYFSQKNEKKPEKIPP